MRAGRELACRPSCCLLNEFNPTNHRWTSGKIFSGKLNNLPRCSLCVEIRQEFVRRSFTSSFPFMKNSFFWQQSVNLEKLPLDFILIFHDELLDDFHHGSTESGASISISSGLCFVFTVGKWFKVFVFVIDCMSHVFYFHHLLPRCDACRFSFSTLFHKKTRIEIQVMLQSYSIWMHCSPTSELIIRVFFVQN